MVTKADLESLTVAVGKLQQEAETRANAAEEKKKAETAATPPAAPATTASTTAPAKKMVWILKSAKPGTAWVAEKGSRELRTVSVGDTLPGIGKVTSIDKNAEGLWEVVGEEGRIGQ